MLTSTDDAQLCVNSLKSRTPRNPTILIGHYRLRDNLVTLILKKQELKTNNNNNNNQYRRKRREFLHDSGEQTFHAVSINNLLIFLSFCSTIIIKIFFTYLSFLIKICLNLNYLQIYLKRYYVSILFVCLFVLHKLGFVLFFFIFIEMFSKIFLLLKIFQF